MRDDESSLTPEEDEEVKRERMRVEVTNEILISERYYVRDLELVVDLFLNPVRSLSLLTESEIGALFSNIELILKVNHQILQNLLSDFQEAQSIQELNIGGVFLQMVEYLKIYSIYSSNHQTSITAYDKLKTENKNFASFLKQMEAEPKCQGINLLGFLIKPIQRICKYPLLFKELMKFTPKEHSDYDNIENCYKKVQEVANYVNEKKRTAESLQKMLEIQDNLLDAPKGFRVIESGRLFLREADFTKVNNRGKSQERHFFLFTDMLMYCEKKLFNKSYEFKGMIPLNSVLVHELADEENKGITNGFELVRHDSAKKKYRICTNSPTEKQLWLSELGRLIDSFLAKERERDKTRNSVLGNWK